MLSRLLTAKVAVATLTAVVAIGGVATAATVVRTASERDNAKAVADVGKAGAEGHGLDASGPAREGLCRAWAAGNGGDEGGKEDAAAFQALVRAAGGEGKVAAFCASTGTSTSSTGKADDAAKAQSQAAADAAKSGLCKAWAASRDSNSGQASSQRMDAGAFDALANAAGGAANIPTFCAAAGTTTEQGQDPSAGVGQSGEHRAPAADADRGSDQADQSKPTSNG